MTKEEKQLLLIDLCGRLLYGVKANIRYCDLQSDEKIKYRDIDITCFNIEQVINNWLDCKPYLRLMSSVTEEEYIQYQETQEWKYVDNDHYEYFDTIETFDWLNSHHFDYRGLIEKGLALEAPEGMYKTE